MKRLYPRIYRAVTGYGYSPAHAERVLLDARRNDPFALLVIRAIVSSRRHFVRLRFALEELMEAP